MWLIAHGKPAPASLPRALRAGASLRCMALAAALALPAHAAAPADPLSAAVLQLDRDAQALDGAAQAPQLSIDIGSRIDGALLREVVVQIDGRTVARHRYSDREALALRGDALHPLVSLPLEEGEHQLRADFIARAADARPGDARLHAQIEQTYRKPPGAARIELTLLPQGWGGQPAVQLQDGAQPGAVALEDPRLRAADFWLRSDQPLAAALLLQRMQQDTPLLPPAFERRHADSLAALGLAPAPDSAAPAVEHYNRALAALGGDAAQGAAQLEALGSAEAAEAADATALALRDLANLTLGYHWLRLGEGDKAKPVLARIRSPGPYANAALLGFGWAFLVPAQAPDAAPMFAAQAPLWPAAADDAAQLRRSLPFRYLHSVAIAGERRLDLQRALIPWIELIGRDAGDPAVQEGLLALPYALGHLGAHEQAQQYTRRAIEQLEQARSELDAAQRHVASGALAELLQQRYADQADGWRAELADLPYAADTAYLRPLLQQEPILLALATQRRLGQLGRALQAQAQRLAAAEAAAPLQARLAMLQQQVEAAAQAQRQQLQELALAQLRARQQHTLRYLAEARLALARIHDRPLEGAPS